VQGGAVFGGGLLVLGFSCFLVGRLALPLCGVVLAFVVVLGFLAFP
jgi:hypothetical protein